MSSHAMVVREPRLTKLPAELFDKITSFLSTADFMKLRQTCRYTHNIAILHRRFSINTALISFVSDADLFRSMQGRHNVLIGGAFAQSFIESNSSKISTLDLLVEGGHENRVKDHIKHQHAYEREEPLGNSTVWKISRVHIKSDYLQGLSQVLMHSSKRAGKSIRLTVTASPPCESILLDSCNTVSVACISWNKAYSVFPLQTLVHHKSHPLKQWDDKVGRVLKEQANQGWTTRDIVWPEIRSSASRLKPECRRFGDRFSLILPLEPSNVRDAMTPDYVMEHAQFEICAEQVSPRLLMLDLASPALRYKYTFAKPSWQDFVESRLQRWTWVELLKLEEGERRQLFPNGMPHMAFVSLPADFEPSNLWDYADDQMSSWYQEWERSLSQEIPKAHRTRHRA